jgi:hypothetical protein
MHYSINNKKEIIMRIHTEHTENFIQALATSVNKDPASLENWRCLHVKNAEENSFDWIKTILEQMKNVHKDVDCEAIHCADNDVLFISRNLHDDQLHGITSELTNAAFLQDGAQSEITDVAIISAILIYNFFIFYAILVIDHRESISLSINFQGPI